MTYSILRKITALSFLLSSLMGAFIYQIKHRVIDLEQSLNSLNHEIIATNEDIHILKAEWGYLNQPERLKDLSDKYLQLRPIGHTQVASYKTFPTIMASRKTKGNRVIIA